MEWDEASTQVLDIVLAEPFRVHISHAVLIDENIFLSDEESLYEKQHLAKKIFNGEKTAEIYRS